MQRTSSNGTPTSGRHGGRSSTPSSSDRPRGAGRGGGGGSGRGGRGRSSPYTTTDQPRLPRGGGSTGNRAAFDRGRIFNGGGQQAVRYEKEKRLWKVGPPTTGVDLHHYRFQLDAFLQGLTQFIQHQVEQQHQGSVLGQGTGNGRGTDNTRISTSTASANSTVRTVLSNSSSTPLGEFSALALIDDEELDLEEEEEDDQNEEDETSSSPPSSPSRGGGSATEEEERSYRRAPPSRKWWTSPSIISPANLPRNAVATKEEQEFLAAFSATVFEQQRQRQDGRSQPPKEGPLELSLRLERLDLTDIEAGILADWAEEHFQSNTAIIKKIWLFGNRISDDGAAAVARIIALGTVTECHLSHNLISLVGAQKLLETVPVAVVNPKAEKEEANNAGRDTTTKDSGLNNPLWLRLEWNRISLSGLVNVLEAQHAQRGLLCDVPEAAREEAAPPLPALPGYLQSAKEGGQNNVDCDDNDDEAVQERRSFAEEEDAAVAVAATPPVAHSQRQNEQKSTNTNSAFTRSTRNQLKYIIERCHCRLPWVSSQFETPSEAAVLLEAKNLWGKKENSSSTTTATKTSETNLPVSPSSGPLLLVPDTSALLAMAGADASVTTPTFFTLEWLFNLSTQGLFGRTLPPREQIFIIVPASVATQLDALKADAGARGAVRRFMNKGLDDMGPAGANFLTMLGAHEGEGLVLEHAAEVAGSRGADVGSRGQAIDHRIVEVGLYFQQECVKAALGLEIDTSAGVEEEEEEKKQRQPVSHFASSLPVILLTSDNGQQALAKAHGLPAVRMSDIATTRAHLLGHVESGQPLTASILRAALRPAATAALGKVAARSLQMEFDGVVACLRAAIEQLDSSQNRERALREQILSSCLEKSDDADDEAARQEFEASTELIDALKKRLEEWNGLIRSHQVASRVVQWSTLG